MFYHDKITELLINPTRKNMQIMFLINFAQLCDPNPRFFDQETLSLNLEPWLNNLQNEDFDDLDKEYISLLYEIEMGNLVINMPRLYESNFRFNESYHQMSIYDYFKNIDEVIYEKFIDDMEKLLNKLIEEAEKIESIDVISVPSSESLRSVLNLFKRD